MDEDGLTSVHVYAYYSIISESSGHVWELNVIFGWSCLLEIRGSNID